MTSVMSARSPLSISKCRESVWPEAAKRKGSLCQDGIRKEGGQVSLMDSRVEVMGKPVTGRYFQGRKLQIRTFFKFSSSLPYPTVSPNSVQEGFGMARGEQQPEVGTNQQRVGASTCACVP